ncbi:MAG: hypothetical protein JWM10_886 [Myxococcaceae bacterium]|nr:hypothetical protein [Myxococcaceae bacterium]
MAPPRNLLRLFDHNPPPREFVTDLFCDREEPMELGLSTLAGLPECAEILAVYGETRAGKSHFVRVLLDKLERREGRARVETINANNRGVARAVLQDIFLALWRVLNEEVRGVVAADQRAAFEEFLADLDERRALVTQEVAERSDEASDSVGTAVEAGLGAKVGALEVKLGDRTEQRTASSARRVRRAPGEAELVEYIRDALDALRQHQVDRPLVLLVDDLDLLHRRGREGSEESSRLVDRLKPIAEHPQILVIVTVRAAYFNGRDKDFNDFVRLRLLGDDDLREVYRRHVALFHEGVEVFDAAALDVLVRAAKGRVGMFLKSCRDVSRFHASRLRRGLAVGLDGIEAFVRAELEELRQNPDSLHLVPALERALENGQLEVELTADLQDTPLLYSVLHPVPGQPHRYAISPLWAAALRPKKDLPS